jgi:hypothetical protein
VTPTNAVSLLKSSVAFVTNGVANAFRAVGRGVGSLFA